MLQLSNLPFFSFLCTLFTSNVLTLFLSRFGHSADVECGIPFSHYPSFTRIETSLDQFIYTHWRYSADLARRKTTVHRPSFLLFFFRISNIFKAIDNLANGTVDEELISVKLSSYHHGFATSGDPDARTMFCLDGRAMSQDSGTP